MIGSVFYFLCFIILLFHSDKGIRIMSVLGMVHIFLENTLLWWFSSNTQFFDLSLYLNLCWFLDISFIFGATCILSGWKKKLTLSVAVPILFCQIISMQFPLIIPGLFDFVINSSYQTWMEITILCANFKDTTIKEWIKTATVISLLVLARALPPFTY